MDGPAYKTVDEYINGFQKDVQDKLKQIRTAIKAAAPVAEEKISYRMPAYTQGAPLVYFAAFISGSPKSQKTFWGGNNHVGFYPTASGIEAFKDEFEAYKSGKGSVQFPMNEPLPIELVTRVSSNPQTMRRSEKVEKA